MKKVKLPRKKKKAFIKKSGKSNYIGLQILNELLAWEGKKNGHKFPKTYSQDKRKIISYY